MNLTELASEFTILFEDLATQGSKGLDDYEKSVCFTHVQEQVIKQLAQAKMLDPISTLVKFSEETTIQTSIYTTAKEFTKVNSPFHVCSYFIKSNNGGDIGCIEQEGKFITSLLASPYKYPPKNLAYVVMGETRNIVFPPFNYDLKSLVTKYVEYPSPIILSALSGEDSINGITIATDPILDKAFHRELVKLAVQYAIEIYIGQPEKQVPNDSSRNKQ